ncbi:MAG: sporulation integral membrane protein YtvI [Oscillospiraceae bacterium]|nr:sporulation integral membrane protein YtvI [Oscillospiraceae bacterium]
MDPQFNRLFDPEQALRRGKFLINFIYLTLILATVILAGTLLFRLMLPFLFAFAVAAALQRPLRWLGASTLARRKVFSVLLVVLLVLLIAGLVAVSIWQIIAGITNFVSDQNNIKMITNTVASATESINAALDNLKNNVSQEVLDFLKNSIDDARQGITSLLTGTVTAVTNAAARLPSLLVSFLFWVIASIFLTIDYEKVTAFLFRQIPERHRQLSQDIRSLFSGTLMKLIRTYMLLMGITFVELLITFLILGIPHALLFAALTALVDILPVLGTGTILIPWSVIAVITGDMTVGIGLAVGYVLITVIRNYLEPKLVSQQIGLNPLVTLFFMYLGLKLAGLPGMLLLPVVAMIFTQLQEKGKVKLWR